MKITRHGDIGTKELLKHKSIKITIVDGQPKARVSNIAPIHTMYERGSLTMAQFSAGTKLYECFIRGYGERSSCEIRERVDGGGRAPEITTSQIQAMNEYARGIKAASIDVKLINRVVLHEQPLTSKGDSGYKRSQLAKALKRGLTNIAITYGFM